MAVPSAPVATRVTAATEARALRWKRLGSRRVSREVSVVWDIGFLRLRVAKAALAAVRWGHYGRRA